MPKQKSTPTPKLSVKKLKKAKKRGSQFTSPPASTTPPKRQYRRRGTNRSPSSLRRTRDTSLDAGRTIGANLLDALGGRESVMSILDDSNHPKARLLHDRLNSSDYATESFANAYSAIGLRAVDVLEIFQDVQQARVFISALQESDGIMRSVIRAAKDKFTPHDKCDGSGKVIDRKTGKRTSEECKPCYGTGYVNNSGSIESQKLYFELVGWKKQGGLVNIGVDARKQQAVVFTPNSGLGLGGGIGPGMQLAAPGEVPNVVSIIKRAEQVLLPPVQSSSVAAAEEMPEEVMEAEEVEVEERKGVG